MTKLYFSVERDAISWLLFVYVDGKPKKLVFSNKSLLMEAIGKKICEVKW